jgi:hypothetical protein
LGGAGEGRVFEEREKQMFKSTLLPCAILLLAGTVSAQELNLDTVYEDGYSMSGPDSMELRLTNRSDTAWFLDKLELVLAPNDTFETGTVNVVFRRQFKVIRDCPVFFVLGNWGGNKLTYDLSGCGDTRLAKDDTLRFYRFLIDPCYCLVKETSKIKLGQDLILKVRLVFSTRQPGSPLREKFFCVKGKYRYGDGIMEGHGNHEAPNMEGAAYRRLLKYNVNGRMRSLLRNLPLKD